MQEFTVKNFYQRDGNSDSDSEESDEDLPELELASGNKDACIIEVGSYFLKLIEKYLYNLPRKFIMDYFDLG
jgi:hypothetical protein